MLKAVAMNNTTNQSHQVSEDYLKLVMQCPIRVLYSEHEYDASVAVLDGLVTRTDLSRREVNYVDALTTFVQMYDSLHYAIDDSDLPPAAVLAELMEQHAMTTSDLGAVIGSKGVASEILNGKRGISLANMAKLGGRFGVDPAVFLDRRMMKRQTKAVSAA